MVLPDPKLERNDKHDILTLREYLDAGRKPGQTMMASEVSNFKIEHYDYKQVARLVTC